MDLSQSGCTGVVWCKVCQKLVPVNEGLNHLLHLEAPGVISKPDPNPEPEPPWKQNPGNASW